LGSRPFGMEAVFLSRRTSQAQAQAEETQRIADGPSFQELLCQLTERHDFELLTLRKELQLNGRSGPERGPASPAAFPGSEEEGALCAASTLAPHGGHNGVQDAAVPRVPSVDIRHSLETVAKANPDAEMAELAEKPSGTAEICHVNSIGRKPRLITEDMPDSHTEGRDWPTHPPSRGERRSSDYGTDGRDPGKGSAGRRSGPGGTSFSPMTKQGSTASTEKEFELKAIWHALKKATVSDHHALKKTTVQTMEFPESNEHIIDGGRCAKRFVLHPSSLKRLAWDLFGFACLSYDIVIIPFQSAFNPPPFTFGQFMGIFSMVFWTVDIPLSMITGFQKGGSTVMVPRYILGKYARTWLLMDLCVVGLDWGVMIWTEANDGAETNDAVRQGRSLRMLRYLRALRLLRLLKLRKIFNEIQDHINTEMLATSFTIIRIIVGLVVANHIIACGWFALGESKIGKGDGDNEHSWVAANKMMERNIGYRYATSMHWSLTQFTPASMEIRPYNFGERLFSIIVLIMAMVTFSSFVSTLTASITRLSDIRKNELRQFWLLRRYLRDLKISRQLALRVQRYVEYSFARQQSTVQESDVKLLMLLSEPLREELKVEIFGPCLCIHPLFEEIQDSVRGFSKAMQALNIAHGDIVFSYGEESMEMYFVTRGQLQYERGKEVELLSSEQEDPEQNSFDPLDVSIDRQVTPDADVTSEVETLSRGEWLCEPPLWTNWHHRGFLTAQSDCTLVAVDSSQFSVVIRSSAPNWGFVRRYATNYVELLNNLKPATCSDVMNREFPNIAADGLRSASSKSIRNTGIGLSSNRMSKRRMGTHGRGHGGETRLEMVQLAWLRFKNWRWTSWLFTPFGGRDSQEIPGDIT